MQWQFSNSYGSICSITRGYYWISPVLLLYSESTREVSIHPASYDHGEDPRWWPVLRTDSDRKDQANYLCFTRKTDGWSPWQKNVLFIRSKIRQTRILNPYKPINLVF